MKEKEKVKRKRSLLKRANICFLLLTLFAVLAGMGRIDQKAGAAVSEKKQIANAVKKKLPKKHKVKKVFYLDYDKNGRKEAFVLTGKPVKGKYKLMEDGMNTLWFGWKEDGAVHIQKVKKNISITAHTLKLKSASFLCAGRMCPTSYPEDLYQVDGNRVSAIFSGDWIQKLSGDDFISVDSTYDSMYDAATGVMMGHTWKPYYFYYENGKVQEYVAEKISEDELRDRYSNAASVLKKNKKKGTIASILLRSNGLLHINYRMENKYGSADYWYVTYQVKENKLVKSALGDGYYKEKLLKESE